MSSSFSETVVPFLGLYVIPASTYVYRGRRSMERRVLIVDFLALTADTTEFFHSRKVTERKSDREMTKTKGL